VPDRSPQTAVAATANTGTGDVQLRRFPVDLHIHTALSPCGGDEMTPPAIVAAALERGLALIAVCDHNTARNAAAVRDAAGEALAVLPGMEITTAEEAHVVGLFPSAEAALAAADEAGRGLPETDASYTTFFGEQDVLAADGSPAGKETRSLALATAMSLDDTVALIHAHDGLAVAAHVDRRSFGVIAQLGFFPAAAGFDAIEVSRFALQRPEKLEGLWQYGLPVISSSDAHYLEDVGAACSQMTAAAASFVETAAAMAGLDARSIVAQPSGPDSAPLESPEAAVLRMSKRPARAGAKGAAHA
jgi:3',5'-nucleoside bisphosphate phosphatase